MPAKPSGDDLMIRRIIDHSLDILCVIDRKGVFLWLNNACEQLWGYRPEELTGRRHIDFVASEDVDKTEQLTAAVMQGTSYTNFENKYVRKDGTIIPMLWSASWDSQSDCMTCVGRDGTEKHEAEKKHKEREQLLKDAMRMARMGSWEYYFASRTPVWSDELLEIYGLNESHRQQNLGAVFMSIVHPDDVDEVLDVFHRHREGHCTFQHRIIRPDGALIYVNQTIHKQISLDGQMQYVAGTAQDITDRMKHQQELETREKRFHSMIKNGYDLIGLMDANGRYLYLSDSARQILGHDPEFFIGKNTFDFMHPDDTLKAASHLASLARERILTVDPIRFRHENGEWKWLSGTLTNLLDDPAVQGIVVNATDVTDKKAAQDRLAELSTMVEETVNGVVITDQHGLITWVNNAFTRLTGYTCEEAVGKKPGALLQGPDTDPETIRYMRDKAAAHQPFQAEVLNYHKDGQPYWVHLQCQPRRDDEHGTVRYFAIQTDISERKHLEEQLKTEREQRQRKMASAIVSAQEKERDEISKELHDNVNQMLAMVKLYIAMIKDPAHTQDRGDMTAKSIALVQECIDEIRKLSKTLSSPSQRDLGLEDAIRELVDSLAATGKLAITYESVGLVQSKYNNEVELTIFRIAQEHLTNVLRHAAASNVHVSLRQAGGRLQLRITDDGKGFDVTAKKKGLGISHMMHRAYSVQGQLNIQSREGHGCVLSASFPF